MSIRINLRKFIALQVAVAKYGINEVPGYEIRGVGDTRRSVIEISGLQLVQEKSGDTPS